MKLHSTSRWQRQRRWQLRRFPLCAYCLAEGKVVAANVADHVTPHHGDEMKFWFGPLQSVCTRCHESRKKVIEHKGFDTAIGTDGLPTDPNHICYRQTKLPPAK
jgi:5-methylcytosine-specific restriction enzyme A